MLKNYLKITLRNIKRQKGYAFINFTGLTIGITSCILILIYILFELSYDKYHENTGRIFRLCADANLGGNVMRVPISNYPSAPTLRREYPEVLNTARFESMPKITVQHESVQFFEEGIFYADSSVFNIFTFPMIAGDPNSALATAYSVVISEDIAKKYFGDSNPLGKTLKFNNQFDYKVTGVIKNVPKNSHFVFDMLCSYETLYTEHGKRMENWFGFSNYTYILLKDNYDYKELEQKFPALINRYFGKTLKALGGTIEYFLQPLTTIHLHSHMEYEISGNSDINYVYIFASVALFILLIACINYMNLATARSASRVKEVGIRKVVGSSRKQLINQFLNESLIFSFFSLITAIILVKITLPFFSSLSGSELRMNELKYLRFIPIFISLVLFVGLGAGSYPAFCLSAFQPVYVLKNSLKAGVSNFRLRSFLVIIQFTLSITLIIGTGIIIKQLNYMKNTKLGFDKEQVVVLPIMDNKVRKSLDTVKEEFRGFKGVMSIAASSEVPGKIMDGSAFVPEGFSKDEAQLMDILEIDPDFIPTLGIEIIQGRNFSSNLSTDKSNSIIINETAAGKFGWDDPVGKTIRKFSSRDINEMESKTIIGVIQDFHMTSMHRVIDPLYITIEPDEFDYISVRINPGALSETMDFLQKKWKEIDPHHPFDYFFLDESFDSQYKAEERLRSLFSYFTFLAIFIACLGLFGLASFIAERRTKEIGIRKVLGASSPGIVFLISKDFLKWVFLAIIIAWPTAYFISNRWLQNFAYRAPDDPLIFIYAGILTIIIAFTTVSTVAFKSSRTNPINSLKYE